MRNRGRDRDTERVDVVVLDTIGELATIYQIATVVFVGGSLVTTGGHNVLEPAVFGKRVFQRAGVRQVGITTSRQSRPRLRPHHRRAA